MEAWPLITEEVDISMAIHNQEWSRVLMKGISLLLESRKTLEPLFSLKMKEIGTRTEQEEGLKILQKPMARATLKTVRTDQTRCIYYLPQSPAIGDEGSHIAEYTELLESDGTTLLGVESPSPSSNKSSPHRNVAETPQTTTNLPECLEDEMAVLKEEFKYLVFEAANDIGQSSEFVRVKKSITRLPVSNRHRQIKFLAGKMRAIHEAKDIHELFSRLDLYWDYLNCELLKLLINKFGSKRKKQRMDEYLKRLKEFRTRTTVREFIDKSVGDIPSDFADLVLEMEEEWMNCSLEAVEELKTQLSRQCSFSEYALLLINRRHSSVTLCFAVQGPFPMSDKSLQPAQQFLQEQGVQRVFFKEVCLLDLRPPQNESEDTFSTEHQNKCDLFATFSTPEKSKQYQIQECLPPQQFHKRVLHTTVTELFKVCQYSTAECSQVHSEIASELALLLLEWDFVESFLQNAHETFPKELETVFPNLLYTAMKQRDQEFVCHLRNFRNQYMLAPPTNENTNSFGRFDEAPQLRSVDKHEGRQGLQLSHCKPGTPSTSPMSNVNLESLQTFHSFSTNNCSEHVDVSDASTIGSNDVEGSDVFANGSEDSGTFATGSEDSGTIATSSEDSDTSATGSEDSGTSTTDPEDSGTSPTDSEDSGTSATSSEDSDVFATPAENSGTSATSSEDSDVFTTASENSGTSATSSEDSDVFATASENSGTSATSSEDSGTSTTDSKNSDASAIKHIEGSDAYTTGLDTVSTNEESKQYLGQRQKHVFRQFIYTQSKHRDIATAIVSDHIEVLNAPDPGSKHVEGSDVSTAGRVQHSCMYCASHSGSLGVIECYCRSTRPQCCLEHDVHSIQDSPLDTSNSEWPTPSLKSCDASSLLTDQENLIGLSDEVLIDEDTTSESGGTDSTYCGTVEASRVEWLPHSTLKRERKMSYKRHSGKPAFNGPHHVPFPRSKSTNIKCRPWMNHPVQKYSRCLSKDLKKRRRAIAQQRIEGNRESSSGSDEYYPVNAPDMYCVQDAFASVSTTCESASEQSATATATYCTWTNLASAVTVVKCCRSNTDTAFQCLHQQQQKQQESAVVHSSVKCYEITQSLPSQQEHAIDCQSYCNCAASPVPAVKCWKVNSNPISQCMQQQKQQEATQDCAHSPLECYIVNPSPTSQCLQQQKQQEAITGNYCHCAIASPVTVVKCLMCNPSPTSQKQQGNATKFLSCFKTAQNNDAVPSTLIPTTAPAINGAFFRLFGIPHALKHSNFCLIQQLDVGNPLNQCKTNALHIAVPMVNKETLTFLLNRCDVSMLIKQCDSSGKSPLVQSMYRENPEILELLLCELIRSDGCQELRNALPTEKLLKYSLPQHQLCFKPILSVIKVLSCCGESTEEASTESTEKAAIGEPLVIYENRKLQVLQLLPFDPGHCVQDENEGDVRGINQNVSGCSVPVQAVDNDLQYSCMHYASHNGSLEVIKRHFRSTRPQCCLKHTLQSMVVRDFSSPGQSRHQVAAQSDRHSDLDTLTPPQNKDLSQPAATNKPSVIADSPLTTGEQDKHFRVQLQHKHYRHRPPASTPHQTSPTTGGARWDSVDRYSQQHESNSQRLKECNEQIRQSAELLHAQYYAKMLEVLSFGKVSEEMPPKFHVALKFGCALAYYKLSKNKEAKTFFKECEELASRAGQTGDVSLCSVYCGDIEASQQSFLSAAREYSKAIDNHSTENVARDFRMVAPSISGLYAKLGSALRNASKAVDAIQAYRKAIATADAKRDKLAAHTSLGNLYQSLGEYNSAKDEYEHSIKLSEELHDHVSLGWAHGNMGNAYLGLFQKDKALHHLEKSLDLTVDHEPTPQAIGRAYNNLGTAYQALNNLDKAQEYYDLALGQAIYGNDIPGQARVYGNIGNVLMIKKDYERATPHYTKVLRLSRDRATVSTAFHNRGCAYYEWAETKKQALLEIGKTLKVDFHLFGSDFADCDGYQPPIIPNSILKYFKQGSQDLDEVVKFHEESLESIKGSSKGLNLSVSLFESNSRTFHRLQDCLVNLGEYEKALLVAEQSRARTLGELLLKKKSWQIRQSLTAPLNLQQVIDIVKSQNSPVVYLSYTGARLLVWVLTPNSEHVHINMFEAPLEGDQFDGKSFNYHLRYRLTEVLVEKSFEMYTSLDYTSEANEPVRNLHELIAKPLQLFFKSPLHTTEPVQDVVLIPDSYTTLLPFTSLLDPESGEFLGDHYSFRIMPSLLTMGILDQLPPIDVKIPADSQNMCVVGNPSIPTFMYNGEPWALGKLPHAASEAEWVAHILQTTPILEEQATKNAVLLRIMHAKVIHIATHGSAVAGFLAFAGMPSSQSGDAVSSKNILLYPDDVEHLNISPALVVLSSCDSGRGTVKADGIISMARAFILAGAQAVLTTLWRVPDESASVFMQFFYQFLMDGLKSSLALQKAILSLRCFSKYSQYIHWSGYQLTGRSIVFDVSSMSEATHMLKSRLGSSSVFPHLDIVKKLESAFIKDPQSPTDVQILRGSPCMKPSEPLIDFIHSFYTHFMGGIFWINPDWIVASLAYIENKMGKQFHDIIASENQPVLVVFDNIENFPQFSNTEGMINMLKKPNVHVVMISKHYTSPDDLQKVIDLDLLRGSTIIDVKPLSMIHATQRLVHSILNKEHLAPNNKVQATFEKLAKFSSGSPEVIDVNSALLLSHMKAENEKTTPQVLEEYVESLSQPELDKPVSVDSRSAHEGTSRVEERYDSWQAIMKVINECNLRSEEQTLLYCLSMFDCSPIPMSVVLQISTLIAKASHHTHISGMLYSRLLELQLLKQYPTPVILHPSLHVVTQQELEFVYVPQVLTRAIWKDEMSRVDRVVALGIVHNFGVLHQDPIERKILCSLCVQLLEVVPNQDLVKPAPDTFDSVDNTKLDEDDLFDVLKEVHDVTKWINLGLACGLRYPTLEKIEINHRYNVDDCKRDMLAQWLRMVDKVTLKGGPSWRSLAVALCDPIVGYPHIASKIVKNHPLPQH